MFFSYTIGVFGLGFSWKEILILLAMVSVVGYLLGWEKERRDKKQPKQDKGEPGTVNIPGYGETKISHAAAALSNIALFIGLVGAYVLTSWGKYFFTSQGSFWILLGFGVIMALMGWVFAPQPSHSTPSWYKKGLGGYPFSNQKQMNYDGPGPEGSKYAITTNPHGYLAGEKMPNGSFSPIQKYAKGMAWMLAISGVLLSVWLMVNTELKDVGQSYFALSVVSFTIALIESAIPRKSVVTASAFTGYGVYTKQIIWGVAVATVVLSLNTLASLEFVTYQVLTIADDPWIGFALTSFFIPLIEEFAFGGVIFFSIAETAGWVNGLVVIMIFFWVFHASTYGEMAVAASLSAILFRGLSSYANLRFKSLIPGLVGHMIVNSSASLAVAVGVSSLWMGLTPYTVFTLGVAFVFVAVLVFRDKKKINKKT